MDVLGQGLQQRVSAFVGQALGQRSCGVARIDRDATLAKMGPHQRWTGHDGAPVSVSPARIAAATGDAPR
jgi:hypothetical protein